MTEVQQGPCPHLSEGSTWQHEAVQGSMLEQCVQWTEAFDFLVFETDSLGDSNHNSQRKYGTV